MGAPRQVMRAHLIALVAISICLVAASQDNNVDAVIRESAVVPEQALVEALYQSDSDTSTLEMAQTELQRARSMEREAEKAVRGFSITHAINEYKKRRDLKEAKNGFHKLADGFHKFQRAATHTVNKFAKKESRGLSHQLKKAVAKKESRGVSHQLKKAV